MMKNILLVVILIFYSYTFKACQANKLSPEDIEILSNNFATRMISFAPLMESQEGTKFLIPTLEQIANEVKINFKITESKKEIVELAFQFIMDENFSNLKHEAKSIGKFIQINVKRFETDQMSLIQEFNFVEQLFLAYYWANWKCDLGNKFEIITHAIDTMILLESKLYNVPISISSGLNRNASFWIKSNSMQNDDKNQIQFTTEKYYDGIIKKEFEVIGYNTLTGEEFKMKDSIQYKIIKNPIN